MIFIRSLNVSSAVLDAPKETKWGAPNFYDGLSYTVTLKASMNLGFTILGLSEQNLKLFEGSGKTMRHIKIHTLQAIDEENYRNLLKRVAAKV